MIMSKQKIIISRRIKGFDYVIIDETVVSEYNKLV